jgi:Periplasmic protein TonB, links inner and outer membranes
MSDTTGGIHIGSMSGNASFSASGDIVAGDKTVINTIVQRIAKELTTTPYKFLASYDIADRDIFFGRDAVIDELAGQVARAKVLLINGASGAGKTSLVNAGLIPRVADNGYTFVAFREYSDPLAQLEDYFARTAAATTPAPVAGDAADEGALLRLIRGFSEQPKVIFLDQFERFFVRVPEEKRRTFIAAFKHCLANSQAQDLCFVIGFRREFLGQLTSEFEELIPEFLNEAYRINLMPLNPAEAREAIVRPLADAKRKILYDPAFVDDVLLTGLAEQTGGGATIDPPHLQIVCNQLYEAACRIEERNGSALINAALYEQLGGAGNILNTYLDKVVEDIAQDPERIAIVHSILKTMVDAGSNTRSFVALDGFSRTLPDVNEAEILKFVEKLLDRRVVEERKPTYSLSHEHMVAKVKEWFDPRELERKRAEETLGRGMMEWQNSGALLNRKQVEGIRTWVPELAVEEQELLAASETQYLEEERQEAARKRLKKLSLYGAAVFTLLVVVLGIFSWFQKLEADNQRNEAIVARDQATAAKAKAEAEQKKTLAQRLANESRILISTATGPNNIKRAAALAVHSWKMRKSADAWSASDKLRLMLPNKEIVFPGIAKTIAFSSDSRHILLTDIDMHVFRYQLADMVGTPQKEPKKNAFAGDSRRLDDRCSLTAADGRLRAQVVDGAVKLEKQGVDGYWRTNYIVGTDLLEFTMNGYLFMTKTDRRVDLFDGARIINVGSGRPIARLDENKNLDEGGQDGPSISAALSPDGRFIATVQWQSSDDERTDSSLVRILELPRDILIADNPVCRAGFSSDGKYLLAESADSCDFDDVETYTVHAFDVASGTEITKKTWMAGEDPAFVYKEWNVKELKCESAESSDIPLNENLKAIISARTVNIVNSSSGEAIARVESDAPVSCVAASDDHKWVAIAGRDAMVRLINLDNLDQPVDELCERAGKNLSPQEWHDEFGDGTPSPACVQWENSNGESTTRHEASQFVPAERNTVMRTAKSTLFEDCEVPLSPAQEPNKAPTAAAPAASPSPGPKPAAKPATQVQPAAKSAPKQAKETKPAPRRTTNRNNPDSGNEPGWTLLR